MGPNTTNTSTQLMARAFLSLLRVRADPPCTGAHSDPALLLGKRRLEGTLLQRDVRDSVLEGPGGTEEGGGRPPGRHPEDAGALRRPLGAAGLVKKRKKK